MTIDNGTAEFRGAARFYPKGVESKARGRKNGKVRLRGHTAHLYTGPSGASLHFCEDGADPCGTGTPELFVCLSRDEIRRLAEGVGFKVEG